MTAETGLSDSDLRLLDDLVEEALASGGEESLTVLGYGEISLVLGWPAERPAFACKRLPPFASSERFGSYRDTLEDYLGALATAGVRVVETEMRGVERRDGSVAGYLVQPVLATEQLAPAILRRSDTGDGHPLVEALVATAAGAVSPRVGLDAQLSNWAWDGSALTYIDVTTPLIWSPDGRSRLDLDLLAQAYPAILRRPLRRFVAPGILDTYRDLRKVYLDLAGNLLKERLDPWLPLFLDRLNGRIEEPLDEHEVRRYYRSDARLWGVLLRIRRLDRAWRRRVRRRPYPFLLPQRIER
ncbi:MAG TPA: DUF6206 family protein [Solirubrobacterales bacterium]|nr:DUF6206 family protein [Solirubrobacterales bacterium]